MHPKSLKELFESRFSHWHDKRAITFFFPGHYGDCTNLRAAGQGRKPAGPYVS